MAQRAPLSTVDLHRALARLFDEEELRTLCFGLGGVEYDHLRGEGQAAKARELVKFMERRDRLAELEAAVRRERPQLDTTYSPERVQQLRTSILAGSGPSVRGAFVEFTQQIEAYLNEFNLLHEQLEELKKVHGLLQNIQLSFADCRNYIFALSRPRASTAAEQREWERMLYKVEVGWQACKRLLRKLQQLATNIRVTGEPYEPETGAGPDWFLAPKKIAAEIDKALFDDDAAALAEHLSAFAERVDWSLYLADDALLDIVNKINRLPRPGSYIVRTR